MMTDFLFPKMLQAHTYTHTADVVYFLTGNNNEHSGKFEQMKMIKLLMYTAILSGSDIKSQTCPCAKCK